MDTRQGNIYPTRQAALDAGVPKGHAQEVEVDDVTKDASDQLLRIVFGPMKGRVYQRTATGLRRVRTVEAQKERERRQAEDRP